MNTMKYAFAMLGAVAVAPAAHATTLFGTFTNGSFTETFDVNEAALGAVGGSGLFPLMNDSQGATVLLAAESSTGLSGGIATLYVPLVGSSTQVAKDTFAPSPYDSATGMLVPGNYTVSQFGSTLTLSALAGVPEPEAWALLIAGAAMTGGALRGARRRRQSSAMA
jgi:hypothetical protein